MSRERTGAAVRVTAASAQIAAREGVVVAAHALASGTGYLVVHRRAELLGQIWPYGGPPVAGSRWRVHPHGLPKRYRCYCTTQSVALSALLQAHASCPNPEKETPVPWSTDEHIENLIRHITLVRNACVLLGKRMIARGEVEDGWRLIARGHAHDASKWHGIERDILHTGPDVSKERLALAMRQHTAVNDHHPEFHPDGVHGMGRLAIAEMVCDWYARAQEMGTDLRQWITERAMPKYGFRPGDPPSKLIDMFVEMLLPNPFAKLEEG